MAIQWLKSTGVGRFIRIYYLLNALAIATYLFARRISLLGVDVTKGEYIQDWEKNAFSSLGILVLVKSVRTLTVDAFVSDVFMYGKSTILLMTFFMDIRLFSWYLILFGILFLMIPQPFYEGPEDIEYLTPSTYDDLVAGTSQNATKTRKPGEKQPKWLVEFYASWSPPCIHMEPIFAQLSVKYSSENLQFAKMDLGRWPRIAKEFNINIGGTTKQLPTLIMFEAGKEVGRIPHIFADGSVARGRYRKADLIKAFDLDHEGAALSEVAAKKARKEKAGANNKDKKSK